VGDIHLVYQQWQGSSAQCSQVSDHPFHISIGYAVPRDPRRRRPGLPTVVAFESPAEKRGEDEQCDHLRPTDVKKV
jgi:hypothetical protein